MIFIYRGLHAILNMFIHSVHTNLGPYWSTILLVTKKQYTRTTKGDLGATDYAVLQSQQF